MRVMFLSGYLQNARATAQEMTSIVVCVETDEIAVKNTKQNLVADREDSVNLGTREGCVQEETDLDILLGFANLFAQHGRHEHQVVVVYPYHVVVLYILCDSLCEQAVGLGVCVPSGLVEGNLTGVVVEERPHDLVCNC